MNARSKIILRTPGDPTGLATNPSPVISDTIARLRVEPGFPWTSMIIDLTQDDESVLRPPRRILASIPSTSSFTWVGRGGDKIATKSSIKKPMAPHGHFLFCWPCSRRGPQERWCGAQSTRRGGRIRCERCRRAIGDGFWFEAGRRGRGSDAPEPSRVPPSEDSGG